MGLGQPIITNKDIETEKSHIISIEVPGFASQPFTGTRLPQKPEDIAPYILEQRQQIEDYYRRRFIDLHADTEAKLSKLDATERAAWAKFAEDVSRTISDSYGFGAMQGRVQSGGYIDATGLFFQRTRTSVVGNPAEQYQARTSEIAKAKSVTLADFQREFMRLKEQREYDLAELDKLERRLRKDLSTTTP